MIVKDARKDLPPAPEGLWQAVCVDVVDLGLVQTEWGEKRKCRLVWQLETEAPGVNPETGKPYLVTRTFGATLHEKGVLRPFLESWRGRKFTKSELEGFDLEKLLGVNCQLQIVHNATEGGRVFGNVQAVVPVGKNSVKLHAADYTRIKDRPTEQGTGTASATEDDIPF